MKILFLCKANIARSVFASSLYNKLTGTSDAFSAGTKADESGKMLKNLIPKRDFIIQVMDEEGIDVRGHVIGQVTPEMIKEADIVVDMAQPETVPDFAKEHPSRIVWPIDDPKGTSLENHRRVKEDIKTRIIDFLNKNKDEQFMNAIK